MNAVLQNSAINKGYLANNNLILKDIDINVSMQGLMALLMNLFYFALLKTKT